jgi:hypothetical protein
MRTDAPAARSISMDATEMTKRIDPAESRTPLQTGSTQEAPAIRVPPEAEDFAHTLRRLAAERLEKQARNPGLYR